MLSAGFRDRHDEDGGSRGITPGWRMGQNPVKSLSERLAIIQPAVYNEKVSSFCIVSGFERSEGDSAP